MKKVLFLFALMLGVFSAYGQTGVDVVNKYKGCKGVSYVNTDVDAAKGSLAEAESELRAATDGVIDKSFINKFVAGVKGVKTLETVVFSEDSATLLNAVKADVGKLSENGYMVVEDNKVQGSAVGELALAKVDGMKITEVVFLSPINEGRNQHRKLRLLPERNAAIRAMARRIAVRLLMGKRLHKKKHNPSYR